MQTIVANYIHQIKLTLQTYKGSLLFVRKHRLWEGFWNYGWVSRFLIFVSIILGFKFLAIFWEWANKAMHSDTSQMKNIAFGMASDLYNEGFAEIFSGNMRYVMLILLEVIIFHVCRRTLELKMGDLPDPTFKEFIHAQIRMLKVGILIMVLGKVIVAVASIPLGFTGISWLLKPGFQKFIEFFFLGFAVIDNYHEQFHLTIEESLKNSLNYVGVALGIGVVLYVLMAIPIIGPIIGPLLATVTTTLVMYEVSDLHRHHKALPGATEVEDVV
ncbi:MAG: hypothetical protein SFU99_22140 [Saprospiraceae bacterium]|nr:hypothetical protein [Saprospiraceae bacterium]